jgi:CBS domain-containing protein
MVANLLSFAISRRFQPDPVYHALLRQDGVHLPSALMREAGGQTAQMVMSPVGTIVPEDASIDAASEVSRAGGGRPLLVGSVDALAGVVALEVLETASRDGRGRDPVSTLVESPFVHAHPDHPIAVVLQRFGESPGLLPIVSRGQVRRIEGVVTLQDLTRFVSHSRGRTPHTS